MSPLAILFVYVILVLLTLGWDRTSAADSLLALWDSAGRVRCDDDLRQAH